MVAVAAGEQLADTDWTVASDMVEVVVAAVVAAAVALGMHHYTVWEMNIQLCCQIIQKV
jgi:hypothetical protein